MASCPNIDALHRGFSTWTTVPEVRSVAANTPLPWPMLEDLTSNGLCAAPSSACGRERWCISRQPAACTCSGGVLNVEVDAGLLGHIKKKCDTDRRTGQPLVCVLQKRVSSFITDATDAKQRPLPHRELHEVGGAAWRLEASDDIPIPSLPTFSQLRVF